MRSVLITLLLFVSLTLQSQTTVSGMVIDTKGNPVQGANVFLEGTYDGGITGSNGNFEFRTTAAGNQNLVISYLSYETKTIQADVKAMNNLKINLQDDVAALDAVVLTAGTFEAGDKARVSVLKPLDIVTTAGSAGDIVAALQTLPGTQTVGESGRLFVRGGEAGETQTFVDGIRVAQPYGATVQNLPTRGRFSPFLFSGISFSTGGYSAEYGQALSGVLLLDTKDEAEQNQTDISMMTVGLGIGNTRKWEKNSLTINTAYINLEPYQAIIPQNIQWNRPFQSLSGETVYNHRFSHGLWKVYAAFDSSSFDLNQETLDEPQTRRVDLKNNNFYSNTSYKSYWTNNWQYVFGMSVGYGKNEISRNDDNIDNSENAVHLKAKLSKRFSNRFKMTVGSDFFYTRLDEKFLSFQERQIFTSGYTSSLVATYTEADVYFSKRLAAKVGLRFSHDQYLQESYIEPRVSLAYKTGEHTQFSMAYGKFNQAPSAEYLKYTSMLNAEQATHYILNFQYAKTRKTLRLEAYYKEYQNLVRFGGESPLFSADLENSGKGYAGGLDVFWRDGKTVKNLEYWLSYSYIDTKRLYQNFPTQETPSFVATHNASLVTKYWVEKWRSQLGFSHTFHTGRPYNNPNEPGFMTGKAKDFHNLSFNWAYLLSPQKILYFSVSNVLGRQNVFGYEYASTPGQDGTFDRRAITPAADQFFFLGFFWTLSDDKTKNQLDNL